MSKYPEWVNAHKVKGTCVKKVGNSYYLYHATSRRVPDKKNPQKIYEFLGTITKEAGLVRSKVRKISTETVYVYEYGFSRAMQALLPPKFIKDFKNEEKANLVFLSILRYYSPESYLLRGVELPLVSELHVSLNVQIKKLERLIKVEIERMLPLKNVYLVDTKQCEMLSKITPETEALLLELGVKSYDL